MTFLSANSRSDIGSGQTGFHRLLSFLIGIRYQNCVCNCMAEFFKRTGNFFRTIKGNFFLQKRIPLESTMILLRDLYPSIDWKRVDFYEGLPWFTPTIAPYVTAQALPDFYSLSRYRIYLKKFDESRAQCIADIVHEAYHILQAMNFWKGYGFGFFRGFMFYYSAVFAKYGYRRNPFEIPAYDQEYRFLDYCEKLGVHGIVPKIAPGTFNNISKESSLVFRTFKFRYTGNSLLLAGSFIFCSFITVIKPFADTLVFLTGFLFTKELVTSNHSVQ